MYGWWLPGYVEMQELGAGGFGRVVLARHEASGTVVAIKYLTAGPGLRAQFRREAELLISVRSPHVVRFYEFAEHESGAAIVMEAVPGVSLRALLDERRTVEPEAALAVLKGSLLGLAAAHGVGVVHRDYKPANVLVPGDGESKLIDFGIAAHASEPGLQAGTPAYMAPEQWRGEPAAPAADVYAATCVFFECVTGHPPYAADHRQAHLTAPIPVEEVPEALRPLVSRGLAKNAQDRPAAFVEELEAVAAVAYGPAWEERGRRALGKAAAVLIAALPAFVAAGLTGGGPTTAATIVGKALTGGKVTALKIAAGAAGLAVVGGAAVVAVVPEHRAKPKPKPTPVAAEVAVRPCRQSTGLGKTTTAAVPARVRLPAGIRLPPGAVVNGYGLFGGPYYVISPAGACSSSTGADGGTFITTKTAGTGSSFNVMYAAGGVTNTAASACVYFPEIKSEIGCDRNTGDRTIIRLPTGKPGFYVATSLGLASGRIPNLLYAYRTPRGPDFKSIGCKLPRARAEICVAAMDYFLAQGAAEAKLPAADLTRLMGRVRTFVMASY